MIDINLLQVSADGKFIELDLFAPEDYIFDTLMIKKYDYSKEIYENQGTLNLNDDFIKVND